MKKMEFNIDTFLTQLVSADVAFQYRIVPIKKNQNIVLVKTDNTFIDQLQQELEIILGFPIKLEKETTANIDQYLLANYRRREVSNRISSLTFTDDFLMNLLFEAKETGSSDIHFEAFEKNCRVRFRIDGKLIEKYVVLLNEYPKIINRIKIMAGLDISEKRLPQDGRINLTTQQENFDIRVSSLPTLHGEKMVLRILTKNGSVVRLDDLGFSNEELKIYKLSVKKPNGIVLISGPTGSGKTTTLYATLKLLNSNDTNILTIEDPIEYTLEGVNQVQLKESIGLDFASTLRTFLRQDPDIIMVGEIRDAKTANMAIRAALTGHLVLSTIHTNSAWATISRLLDMGIPPFLIASTLNVSVAQRLVRKLCSFCKENHLLDKNDFPLGYAVPNNLKEHYKAVGCNECYHTGYKGRKAIYEIIPINKELVENIMEKKIDIESYLKKNKIATLKDNALTLVSNGITSIEEIYNFINE
ncbi:GspE/PulE family protein [Winogradskyella sp.]|uniref:GspE/PulE family protein n=1 Tax=Winogradskyella sp. TaxID=1883156 RepID=UPI003AB38495